MQTDSPAEDEGQAENRGRLSWWSRRLDQLRVVECSLSPFWHAKRSLTDGQPQCVSISPVLRITWPIPTRPPCEEDAPAQAELGKTEVERAKPWTETARRERATRERGENE